MRRDGWWLGVTVFCAGAAVLILEILGSRLLAPFYGATQWVWSALIAVTLLALSVGYALGGAVADRRDPAPALSRSLVAAGWLVLAVPVLKTPVLPATAALGLRGGALAAAFVLLAPSLILLGSVAPLAAKARVAGMASLGLTVGGLYALSTVGSLAGALAAGFVLIPLLGLVRILLLTALLLFVPAAVFWWRAPRSGERRFWRAAALLGAAAAAAGLAWAREYPHGDPSDWQVLSCVDGRYGEVKVVQHASGRILLLDGTMQSGLELSSGQSIFPYAPAVAQLLLAAEPAVKRVLLVGFGGGILAKTIADRGPRVESVEIDPAVLDAARRWFVPGVDLPVTLEDGRTFLRRAAPASYDAILLDAYAGETPPTHLFTAQAVALVRRALAPDGVGIANVIAIASGDGLRLPRAVDATLRTAFPWVEAYRTEETDGPVNVLFVFGARARRLRALPRIPMHPQVAPLVAGLLGRRLDLAAGGPDRKPPLVFTDDYAPLEFLNLPARERMREMLAALFPAWLRAE